MAWQSNSNSNEIKYLFNCGLYIPEKKGFSLQSLLQHEEKQSRENASRVMEKIMASSGPDKKVSSAIGWGGDGTF